MRRGGSGEMSAAAEEAEEAEERQRVALISESESSSADESMPIIDTDGIRLSEHKAARSGADQNDLLSTLAVDVNFRPVRTRPSISYPRDHEGVG